MTYELSNEEKINIIIEHLKTLELNKFDLNVTLIECLNSSLNSEEDINSLNSQIKDIEAKQDILAKEMADLKTETETI